MNTSGANLAGTVNMQLFRKTKPRVVGLNPAGRRLFFTMGNFSTFQAIEYLRASMIYFLLVLNPSENLWRIHKPFHRFFLNIYSNSSRISFSILFNQISFEILSRVPPKITPYIHQFYQKFAHKFIKHFFMGVSKRYLCILEYFQPSVISTTGLRFQQSLQNLISQLLKQFVCGFFQKTSQKLHQEFLPRLVVFVLVPLRIHSQFFPGVAHQTLQGLFKETY